MADNRTDNYIGIDEAAEYLGKWFTYITDWKWRNYLWWWRARISESMHPLFYNAPIGIHLKSAEMKKYI